MATFILRYSKLCAGISQCGKRFLPKYQHHVGSVFSCNVMVRQDSEFLLKMVICFEVVILINGIGLANMPKTLHVPLFILEMQKKAL